MESTTRSHESDRGPSSRPLVTVCLPTIGRTDYLEQMFGCLRGQTYPDLEILALDNASPIESRAKFERHLAEFAGARSLRVNERIPVFTNFNRGLREARGRYITFFHDDDVYHPRFIESYVAMLEDNPQSVFAGGNFSIIGASGELVRQNRRVPKTEYWDGRSFIDDLITRGRCALPTPGLVFRTNVLAIEGFDESLPGNWGDFPIFMRLAERGDIAVSNEVYFSWRLHGGNASNIPYSSAIPQRTEIYGRYINEYEQRHPDEAAFVRHLRTQNDRNHRVGLLWGWLTAGNIEDAEICRQLLRHAFRPFPLSSGLKLLERIGLSLERRRSVAAGIRNLNELTKLAS